MSDQLAGRNAERVGGRHKLPFLNRLFFAPEWFSHILEYLGSDIGTISNTYFSCRFVPTAIREGILLLVVNEENAVWQAEFFIRQRRDVSRQESLRDCTCPKKTRARMLPAVAEGFEIPEFIVLPGETLSSRVSQCHQRW